MYADLRILVYDSREAQRVLFVVWIILSIFDMEWGYKTQ